MFRVSRLRRQTVSWSIALWLGCLRFESVQAASVEVTVPFEGIRHIHRTTTVPRQLDMHVIEIDLTAIGIDFAITPSNGQGVGATDGQTTREFVTQKNAQIGLNGSFSSFRSKAWIVEGIAATQGQVYSPFEQFRRTALNISVDKVATIIRSIDTGTKTGTAYTPEIPLYNTLGGEAGLLKNGTNVAPSAKESLHPRTAAGVSLDGRKLLLMTVDGRRPGHSLGVTRPELADLLKEYGAWNAINLDGGGSTTLVFSDPVPRVVNIPSDTNASRSSVERTVGSNLAVFANLPPQLSSSHFTYDDFEAGDEGNFGYSLSISASTHGINAAGSSATAVNTAGHGGQWSQQLVIQGDPNTTVRGDNPQSRWSVRHFSGDRIAASPATRRANTIRPAHGRVGLWAMTTDRGLQISLAIVGRSETKADRGTPQSLIADGQWHLYEWNLDQSQMWQVSFQETGVISDPEFTLDSIQIFGSPSSATVFLDDIFHEIRPRDSANAYQSLRD
ncbi:MAG: phosphodiester glycosidase family protein [Planctomycetales bacterium]|nr:phosphodiester glycosidase family protein [Planctomycetales bacterium]